MSYDLKVLRRRAAAVFSAVLLVGCASSALHTEFPASFAMSGAVSKTAAPIYPATIVVRWPALIDPAVLPIVSDNLYRESRARMAAIGVELGPPSPQQMSAWLELLQTASTFYAAELYWSLRRSAPTATVLLEPFAVKRSPAGEPIFVPLVDATLAADLVADLWSSSMEHVPLAVSTFEFSLSAPPIRAPGNCGLMLTADLSAPVAPTPSVTRCSSADPRVVLSSHYMLDGVFRTEAMLSHYKGRGLPLSTAQTAVMPRLFDGNPASVVGLTPSDYVRSSRPASPKQAAAAPLHPYIEQYGRIASSALSLIGPPPVGRDDDMAVYAANFDAALAQALHERRTLTPAQQANVVLLRRMANSERALRARRDEQIASEIIGGNFGMRVRQTRDEAYRGYNQRIASMWGTVLASSAMYGSALQAGGSAAALSAANTSMTRFNTETQAQGEAFISQLAPSLATLGEASLQVLGDSVLVPIADQAAMRQALSRLYKKHRQ